MMYYGFYIGENGLLQADVVGEEKVVHFNEPEESQYGEKVPITGNTYPYKDDINSFDWDEVHQEWTGEYWRVDLDAVRKVIEKLAEVASEVSVDPDVVYECDDLEEYRGKIEIGEDGSGGDETFEFVRGPVEGDERVSRSWAEDAAELGNYDDVGEFADRFNFEVVDDEVLYDDLDEPEGSEVDDSYDLTV